MRLADKTAIVTGAHGGIGTAVVRAFMAEGARVCAADLQLPVAPAGTQSAKQGTFLGVETDVSRSASVTRLVEQAVAAFGRIDILVNVAGTVSFGSAEAISEAEWDRVHSINLKGTFLCCQAVMRVMRANRYGRIINIGSILAKNGGNARPWLDPGEQAHAANIAYGTSKAGVHALTLYLAREVAADGITVNCVAPGPIASAMTRNFPDRLRDLIPMGRMGTADDVAEACVFLASEAAGFVTAEILDVNGGMWGD